MDKQLRADLASLNIGRMGPNYAPWILWIVIATVVACLVYGIVSDTDAEHSYARRAAAQCREAGGIPVFSSRSEIKMERCER